jgi:hypothetical protein
MLGDGKVVLAFFGPMSKMVYSASQRKQIMQGNFAPSAEILEHALSIVQDKFHGPNSETQITDLHIAGASQGAHQAIASASVIAGKQEKYDVKSVTTQELILGPHNFRDLFKGLGGQIGETGVKPSDALFIPELSLLHDIDAHGNEPAMFLRMLGATLLKSGNMIGLTKPGETVYHIDNLAAYGVAQTVLLAENSLITHQTEDHLYPYRNDIEVIKIKATEGQYADHLADENVNVVATGIALGARRDIG